MNESRKALVRAAYNKLDANKDGRVTIKDAAQLFKASSHPDVVQKRRSEEEIYREFLDSYDTFQKDGIVTFEEFMEYYEGVSCMVDSDDYFTQMMKHSWGL